jgi:hypothetical protein
VAERDVAGGGDGGDAEGWGAADGEGGFGAAGGGLAELIGPEVVESVVR